MIYWNQSRHYRLLSAEDRALYIEEMAPMYFCKWMKRINLIINIVAPLYLYFYLHLPLHEIAFAFIAFDIILNVFEQIVLITFPWAISKIPNVAIAQWQYNGIARNFSRVNDRIDFFRKKNCESCARATILYQHCTHCKTAKELHNKLNALAGSKNAAKKRLAQLKAKRDGVQNTPAKTQPTPAIITEQQLDVSMVGYFQNISTECNKLISTHRFDFLIAVRKSADSMASILKNKPEGEIEVSGTLCYRLDNLVRLLTTLGAESDEVRTVYYEDAKQAANAINEEMQQTISSINKLIPGVDTNTPQMLLDKINLTKETKDV